MALSSTASRRLRSSSRFGQLVTAALTALANDKEREVRDAVAKAIIEFMQ